MATLAGAVLASAAQGTLDLRLEQLPVTADRVIIVLDSPTRERPIVIARDLEKQLFVPQHLTVDLPSGHVYRIRAVAIQSGSYYPRVLVSGMTQGVAVEGNIDASAAISFGFINAGHSISQEGDEATDRQLTVYIEDPGETLRLDGSATLWTSRKEMARSGEGLRNSAPIERIGPGKFSATFSLPLSARGDQLFAQFGVYAVEFATEKELPLFVWPDIESGRTALKVKGGAMLEAVSPHITASPEQVNDIQRSSAQPTPPTVGIPYVIGVDKKTGKLVRVPQAQAERK